MRKEPLSIGVVIPAYDRQNDLATALGSVRSQTLPPDRIVVVDDCSNPPLSLPGWAVADSRVQLIRLPENAGAAAARQAGINALDTTHIAFLDADDMWRSDKLQRQISHLATLPDPERTTIVCGWRLVSRDNRTLAYRLPRASHSLADFCSGCWFSPGSTALLPRAMLIDVGGFDQRLRRLEDFDLFLRLAINGGTLAVAPFFGADIRKGQNAHRADVDPAASYLRAKLLTGRSAVTLGGLERRFDSWLSVEEAAAAYNDRCFGRFLSRMLYSLALVPRRSIQLGDWWETLKGDAELVQL